MNVEVSGKNWVIYKCLTNKEHIYDFKFIVLLIMAPTDREISVIL